MAEGVTPFLSVYLRMIGNLFFFTIKFLSTKHKLCVVDTKWYLSGEFKDTSHTCIIWLACTTKIIMWIWKNAKEKNIP